MLAGNVLAHSPDGLWLGLDSSVLQDIKAEPQLNLQKFGVFDLQEQTFSRAIADAPLEFTDNYQSLAITITVPQPDMTFARFAIVEAPVMEPELAAQFPDIKTFRGTGIDDPSARIRFDVTMHGFHAQVLTPSGSYYVDPFFRGQTDYYASYFVSDALPTGEFHEHDVEHEHDHDHEDEQGDHGELQGNRVSGSFNFLVTGNYGPSAQGSFTEMFGTQLRTFRLAVAATGEYTAFHGGTVTAGQSAIVTAVNRVTGIYENDLAIRMVLVANNSSIVYTNPGTDPYSNNNGGTMLGQNQSNLDSVIGNANYDIGHVFSTGGGGIAGFAVVGVSGQKARGVTGSSVPVGDPFTIDYVAHEMGHQFGASHTFNSVTSSCGGGNRSASSAYEPGSGSTIMSYAGICGSDNLQPNSDAMFHSRSIDQIRALVNSIPAVGTTTNTGNSEPTVNAGLNYVIPTNTPFELTAVGSDPDSGNVLTYSWEQRDLGSSAGLSTPDNGSSPLFRTWLPTTSPIRVFPRLSSLVNNTLPTGEKLPTANWSSMDFRVVVRDNSSGGGGVDWDDMSIQVVNVGSSGFAVTSQNSGGSWTGLTTQTITWNVANTTSNPINAANVDIWLSTDGGFTYTIQLAAAVPNDGSQTITVPNISTSSARIKVKASGNIFFDINNANIVITAGVVASVAFNAPSYHIGDTLGVTVSDGNAAPPISVTVTSDSGDSETFQLSASGPDFTGNLPIAGGSVTANDGILQTAVSDVITVTYFDPDNGSGNPQTLMDTATIGDCVGDITVSVTPVNSGIAVTDDATGNGYIMYSSESLFTRFGTAINSSSPGVQASNADHLVAVRLNGSQWQYNTNFAWRDFSPTTDDRLMAAVNFTADTVTSLEGTSSVVNGIDAGYSSGDLVIAADMWNGVANEGEFGAAGTFFTYTPGSVLTNITPVNSGIAVTDDATGDGYIMFSAESLFTRFGTATNSSSPGVQASNADHLVAVRLNGTQWQYNTNFAWKDFSPAANDRLLAAVNFTADTVTSLEGTSSIVNGIDAGYASGDLVITADMWNGVANDGEFGASGTFFAYTPGSVLTNITPVNFGIAVTDDAAGEGYIMFSAESLFTRFGTATNSSSPGVFANNADHLVAVRLNGSQWQYNTNFAWRDFSPVANDRLLAAVNFTTDTVTSLEGTSSVVNGIEAGYTSGDLVITANVWNGAVNAGEFGADGTFFANNPGSVLTSITPVNFGIAVTDDATGEGYIMFSAESLFTRFGTATNSSSPGVFANNANHLVAVRLNGSQWQYNTNFAWRDFTPTADDRLLAAVNFTTDTVTSLEGSNSVVNGINAGYASGDLVITANMWNGVANGGEFGASGSFFSVC